MLGVATTHVVFAGCSERTDFFPEDERAGTGGAEHAGAGQEATGGSSALGGGGSHAGSSGSGSASGGQAASGGTFAAGSSGSAGSGASASGTGGDTAQAGTSGGGSSGGLGASGGEAGAPDHESGGTSGEAAGGDGASAGSGGSGATTGVGGSGATAGNGAEGGSGGTAGTGSGGTGGEAGASCTAKTERCNGADDDCNDEVDEGVCPTGCEARTHDGHVYLVCLERNEGDLPDYGHAREHCDDFATSLGLEKSFELARVESASENTFLKQWIRDSADSEGAVWFGANDLDDENMWVFGDDPPSQRFFTASPEGGGMPFMGRFDDFPSGRPNGANGADEDCGAFDAEVEWAWNDVRCSVGRLGFVCEETE